MLDALTHTEVSGDDHQVDELRLIRMPRIVKGECRPSRSRLVNFWPIWQLPLIGQRVKVLPKNKKVLHLTMQDLGSEALASLSSPAGACYPKVVLQARFIGNPHSVAPGPLEVNMFR